MSMLRINLRSSKRIEPLWCLRRAWAKCGFCWRKLCMSSSSEPESSEPESSELESSELESSESG